MGPRTQKRTRASENTIPDNDDLNPISCEACRQRKCKCDRKLPCCSQCSGEPSKCVYPESGKRGLPLGYLNQLEQRLAETEAALYSALVTLQGNMPDTVAQAVSKTDEQKTKSTRMEEWSKLPLRDWPDIGRWMGAVSEQFTINQLPSGVSPAPGPATGIQITPNHRRAPSSTDLELHGISTPFAWQPQDDHSIRSPYAGHIRSQDSGSSPAYSHHTVPGATDGVASSLVDIPGDHLAITGNEPVRAKAEELSRVRSSIYF